MSLYIEERIGEEAVEKAKRGQKPRLATISENDFQAMYQRLQARWEADDVGRYVTLSTAGGRVVVRPSLIVEPDQIVWP